MLQSTLSSIEMILQQQINDQSLTDQIVDLFSHYREGLWLYPGVFKRKFGLSINAVYELLSRLEREGYLKSYYELYCSHCQKSSGIVVETFHDIPDTFQCEMCNEELPGIENAILIYKIVRD